MSAATQRLVTFLGAEAEDLADGAVIGIEARIWEACRLLDSPGQRAAGVELAEQLVGELDELPSLDAAEADWRCQLALQTGRAGRPDLATTLTAPLLASVNDDVRRYAQLTLELTKDVGVEDRIQRLDLERRWAELPADANNEDRLILAGPLAMICHTLGDWRAARGLGELELEARLTLFDAEHSDTLVIRGNIARWTGECGRPADALALFRELLLDRVRVLGAEHPDTQATQRAIEHWSTVVAALGGPGDAEHQPS